MGADQKAGRASLPPEIAEEDKRAILRLPQPRQWATGVLSGSAGAEAADRGTAPRQRVPGVPRDRLPASAIANQTDAWLFRAPEARQQAVHLPLPAGQSVLIGLAAARGSPGSAADHRGRPGHLDDHADGGSVRARSLTTGIRPAIDQRHQCDGALWTRCEARARPGNARPVLHTAFAPAAHERRTASGGAELDTGGAEQVSGGGRRPTGEQLDLLQTEPAAFVQVGDKVGG